MVALGAVITDTADRRVTGAGTHAINDGWEPILRITADRLPGTSTSPDYAFVVTFDVGEFAKPRSTSGDIRATAEVMVCEEGTFGPNTRHVVDMDDILVNPRRGHSAQIIFGGSSWGPAKVLVVYGRTFQRAPIPAFHQPAFTVSSLSVTAWNLTALGASRHQFDIATLTGGTSLAHQPAGITSGTVLLTTSADLAYTGPGTHRWLVYYSTAVVPGTGGAAYTCWMNRIVGGSEDDAWGFGDGGASCMGPAAGVPEWAMYHIGLARVHSVPDGSVRFRVRGGNLYGAGTGASQAHRAAILAIKIDECTGFHEFEQQSAGAIYSRSDAATDTEREINLDAAVPYNVLSIGVPKNEAGRSISFDALLQYNGRTQWTPRLSLVHKHATDGLPHWRVLSRPFDDQLAILTVRTSVAQGEANPAGAQPGRWVTVVGWMMSDDAIGPTFEDLESGPEVEVVPGREALGLGDLSALPIQPSRAIQTQATPHRVEMPTIMGYRVTWPRALKVRRELSLSWSALTLAQVDTLVTFFQTSKTFKWTAPTDIERPYAITSFDVDASDQGRQLHRMSAQVAELVFVGAP